MKKDVVGLARLADRAVRATVSGSFRKAMDDVQRDVEALADAGAFILSPADPRVVDQFGDFLFVASDRVRRIRTVQSRHLAAIESSDFLWLVAPDGYVGLSAAMEIGYAAAHDVPVYSADVVADLTLRQWVTVVDTPTAAVVRHARHTRPRNEDSVLIEPSLAIERSHDDLLIAQRGLLGQPTIEQTGAAEAALARLRDRLVIP